MNKKINLIYVTNNCLDGLYRYLKTKYVHFAIISLNSCNVDLDYKYDGINPLYVHNVDTITHHQANRHFEAVYTYAILYVVLTVLNVSSIIKAEKLIDENIPNNYRYVLSLHSAEYEYRKFPVYRAISKLYESKEILVIFNTKGYGNSILDMPVLQKFYKAKREQGYRVVFWHTYTESLRIAHIFLPDAKHIANPYIDIQRIDYLMNNEKLENYCEVVNMDNLILRSSYTKLDGLCNFFKINNKKDLLKDLQIYNESLDKSLITHLQRFKKCYVYCIGVHFQTYDDAICATKRSWSLKNIEQFLDFCRRKGIGVINLAPYHGKENLFDIDCSMLTISELFTLYSYIDAFVGIESSCAHIAGVLQKKHLMILGKVVDHVSQRPLSMNHTILSKTGWIEDISPHVVFDKLVDLFHDRLSLTTFIKQNCEFNLNDNTISKV